MEIKVPSDRVEDVVKRMYWLAWQACGTPLGLDIVHITSVTEEDVWKNVCTSMPGLKERRGRLAVIGDYVFGRMMKLYLEWSLDGTIFIRDDKPRADYQAWCKKYKTYEDLCRAAIDSVQPKLV